MQRQRWFGILTMRLENVTWPRVIWVLLIAALGGWIVADPPQMLKFRELEVLDLMQSYYPKKTPRVPLVLVVAGERTAKALGDGSPDVYTRLLERLGSSRLVLLDLLFTESAATSEDEAFVAAVQKHGNVLGNLYLAPSLNDTILQRPFPELAAAFKKVGLANLEPDADGIFRQGVWGLDAPGKSFIPSTALLALEELSGQGFFFSDRGDESIAPLPWKELVLERNPQGYLCFLINEPRFDIPRYELIDVLEERVPETALAGAFVVVGQESASGPEKLPVARGLRVWRSEFVLRAVSSLMTSYAPRELNTAKTALTSGFLIVLSAALGFAYFKRGFPALLALFAAWSFGAYSCFTQADLRLPLIGPFVASFCAYIGSQLMASWRMHHEWNVRSLSIKPLLALAQQVDEDMGSEITFDEYLRSLWSEIEEKTGVMLKSTRVAEDLSLVQNYLARARQSHQQDEHFFILRNASASSPHHRMLLPLPFSSQRSKIKIREYVILAWDGKIPQETLTSLAALTLFAAVHFHGIEEGRRRQDMLFKTIEAIMVAVEAKDQTTSEHSRRVAALSRKMAQWMRLGPQEIKDVYFAAIIHDIGKLGIADSVLKKSSSLTEEELLEMRRHPLIGGDIMRPVELPDVVVSGIMQHHENYDGKGYPYGLKGERITTAGKIIKVADVFDALMNRRQYKEAWTSEQVKQFLLDKRGAEFDPQVVDTLLQNLDEEIQNPFLYGRMWFN